jgi:hypothetical protein
LNKGRATTSRKEIVEGQSQTTAPTGTNASIGIAAFNSWRHSSALRIATCGCLSLPLI